MIVSASDALRYVGAYAALLARVAWAVEVLMMECGREGCPESTARFVEDLLREGMEKAKALIDGDQAPPEPPRGAA